MTQTTTELDRHHVKLHKKFKGVSFSYCDPELKRSFHRGAKKYLKLLAEALDLPKGSYDIRSNMAGIACSGEITLHGEDLYVQFHENLFGDGIGIMIRGCRGRKDYSGMGNRHVTLEDGNSDEVVTTCEYAIQEAQHKKAGGA